jgi:tetratricopeptide (TPR) repeat protein
MGGYRIATLVNCAAALAAAFAVAAFAADQPAADTEAVPALVKARPAVVVLPFADKSAVTEEVPPLPGKPFDVEAPMPWLGDGIPAALELALERAATVNLFSRADLAQDFKQARGEELAPASAPDAVAKVARTDGVTHLVVGSFTKNKKELSFTVEVRTVEGETLASHECKGTVTDVFKLVTDGAKFVVTTTGAGDGAGLIPREPTASMEAFRAFGKGSARYETGPRISSFLLATDKDPNFAEAFLKLGDAYRKEKNYEEAEAAYERARSLADYYPSAPTGTAGVARKLDPANVDGVAALYHEALALDPHYAPAYDGLGGLYFAAQKYDDAKTAYEEFVAIWPTDKDGYYALGNTLWLLGKDNPQWKTMLQQAVDNYEKALAIDPDFAACHYNLASVYKIFENVDKAIYHYRRYIELEPNSPKRQEIEETIAAWEAKYGKK